MNVRHSLFSSIKNLFDIRPRPNVLRYQYFYGFYTKQHISSQSIDIPVHIKRTPTDILKALASTVKVDATGPAYKYQDDPFLTPVSNIEKKKFALAKESGRKAARWIRDTHPDCFAHQPDDPVIKEFVAKIRYEEKDVDESVLISSIKNCEVSEAIQMYNSCLSNNIELSNETLQSLLELICYFNGEDPINTEWQEEISTQNIFKNEHQLKTWKDRGLAEEIFHKIKCLGSKPYCAVIRGMCKYFQTEKAWQLYQETVEKSIPLDTDTYNHLFRIGVIQYREGQERWDFIKDILEKLVENELAPNLGTLNSILECLTAMRSWNSTASLSLKVLKDFHRIGIEPSLASYAHLIRIHQRNKNATSPLLISILDQIEGKSFENRDYKDTWFFFIAMEACNNWDLAQRLHNVLLTGENYKLLGENICETIYYKYFILQSIGGLAIDEFMKVYDHLVPFVYSPDSDVLEEIVRTFGVYDLVDEVPRIWSDAINMGHTRAERLLEIILMIVNKHNLETVDSVLASRLATVAWDIWQRVEKDKTDDRIRKRIDWTGQMLGDCVSILSRCGEPGKGLTILQQVLNAPSSILGNLPLDTLQILFNALLKDERQYDCFIVVKYAKQFEYPEALDMAKTLAKNPSLNDELRSKLTYFFGTDCMQ